jgi:hypothetical protein
VKRTLLTAFTEAVVLAVPASGGDILGFTEVVSPEAQTNATEPYVAVDRSDGDRLCRLAGERKPRRPLGRRRSQLRRRLVSIDTPYDPC